MQPRFDGADMPLDLPSRFNGLAIRSYQWLRESRMKVIACLHRFCVKSIAKLNQKNRALRHGIGRDGRRFLRQHPGARAKGCDQRGSKSQAKRRGANRHRNLPQGMLMDWMEERAELLPAVAAIFPPSLTPVRARLRIADRPEGRRNEVLQSSWQDVCPLQAQRPQH